MVQRPDSGARRLLFVSSVTEGGSGRSQRELAAALVDDGRAVRFLVERAGAPAPVRRVMSELADASVRFGSSPLGRPVGALRHRLGAMTRVGHIDDLEHHFSLAPEHAFDALVDAWHPDVVVVSSISRLSWRRVRGSCRRRGLPTVLHLREAPAIGHLTAGLHPDVLLANSGTLVDDAARLGHRAELVPSVVRPVVMDRPPSGEVVVLVNPLPSHGLDVVGPLASARPDIPIVLQESWPLSGDDLREVQRLERSHPNVTFRAFEPRPGRLFRDARILLAPHRVDNRPRTVLEAQTNGLPVVASALPGLVEAVGPGGVLVDPDATVDRWVGAVGRLWDEPDEWIRCSEQARIHAARPEIRPEKVATRFAEIVDALAGGRGGQNSSMSPRPARS